MLDNVLGPGYNSTAMKHLFDFRGGENMSDAAIISLLWAAIKNACISATDTGLRFEIDDNLSLYVDSDEISRDGDGVVELVYESNKEDYFETIKITLDEKDKQRIAEFTY